MFSYYFSFRFDRYIILINYGPSIFFFQFQCFGFIRYRFLFILGFCIILVYRLTVAILWRLMYFYCVRFLWAKFRRSFFFFIFFLHGSPNTRPLKKNITINVRVASYKWFRTRHVVESERSPAKQTHSPYNRESFNFSGEWFWVENFYNMLLVLILYYGYFPWNVLYFNPTSILVFFFISQKIVATLLRQWIRCQTEQILMLGYVVSFLDRKAN